MNRSFTKFFFQIIDFRKIIFSAVLFFHLHHSELKILFLEFKKAVFVFSVFRRREERVIETAEQRFAALQRFAIDRLIMSHSIGPKRFIKYFSLSFSLLIAGTQKYHRIIELRKVNTSGLRRCLNQSL